MSGTAAAAPGGSNWVKTITTPLKKARTLLKPNKDKKSSQYESEDGVVDLHGEVMNCGYEDVQVMWSMLDKSKSAPYNCNL